MSHSKSLLSHTERWATLSADQLTNDAKKHQHYKLALTTVDAVTPSLMKTEEGYLSETGDVQVFLYVALDDASKHVLTSIIVPHCETASKKEGTPERDSERKGTNQDNKNQQYNPRLTVYNEAARSLIAAFLCDFPNALFSVDGGLPLVLFLQEQKLKRYVTLENMIEASKLGIKKIVIAVPKASSSITQRPRGCHE